MLFYVTLRRTGGGFLGGTWAGMGYTFVECSSHLHDYLQLALMLRHPDLQIPHTAQGPHLFRIRGALSFDK